MRLKKVPKKEQQQSIESLHNQNDEHIRTASESQTASALSLPSNARRKFSIEDIEFVHNLIERCLCYYMTKDEVVNTLANRVHIEPRFTTLVWQSLKAENPEFFSSYHVRLAVKEQTDLYNQLVKQHNDMAKKHNDMVKQYHSATKPSLHNDLGQLPVNSSIGNYAEQLYLQSLGATHMDSSLYGSSYHMVNGVPAAGDLYPIQQNGVSDYQEIATEPSDQLSFEPDAIMGLSGQPMTFNAANPSNLGSADNFQLGMYDSSRTSSQNLSRSHSNLTTSLTNTKDSVAIESYQSSPFLYADTVGFMADDFDECDIDDYFLVDDPYHEAQNRIDEQKL